MARYKIWNRTDNIYTPVGEELTPEQWISRYGWIRNPAAVPVVADGLINGAFSGELSQMRQIYENQGADFSECKSNEEVLAEIEAFEDLMNTPSDEPTIEERTAAALEFIAINSMPDML